MAKEVNGRKFKKRKGKIVEIKEEEINLDELKEEIANLEEQLASMPDRKEIPEDASQDVEEAMDYWNAVEADEELQADLEREIKGKKKLLTFLEGL